MTGTWSVTSQGAFLLILRFKEELKIRDAGRTKQPGTVGKAEVWNLDT